MSLVKFFQSSVSPQVISFKNSSALFISSLLEERAQVCIIRLVVLHRLALRYYYYFCGLQPCLKFGHFMTAILITTIKYYAQIWHIYLTRLFYKHAIMALAADWQSLHTFKNIMENCETYRFPHDRSQESNILFATSFTQTPNTQRFF